MLVPRRILAASTLILAVSCRTTKSQESVASNSAPKAAVAPSSGSPSGVAFSSDAEQGLYLQMITVEANAGIKVAKDQLHTSRGLIECRQAAGQAPCTMRVRLEGTAVSASQPLPKSLAPGLWDYARANRPELKDEKLVLMSLLCDYIGKKSPPYDVSSVHCSVSLPRAEDEAVFLNKAAEELSEGIRGETSYGAKVVTLNGAVSCQWLRASPRTPCIVRAQAGGVLQEKITEMSPGVAAEVARGLKQATADRSSVTATAATTGSSAKAAPEESQDIVGALTCLVDNSKSEAEGKRTYVCRAKI